MTVTSKRQRARLIVATFAVCGSLLACSGEEAGEAAEHSPDEPTDVVATEVEAPASDESVETGTAPEIFEYDSFEEVSGLMEELNYTPEAWAAGIRDIPRVYLQKIPPRWRSTVSQEVDTLTKKRIFLRAMAPLVLHANEQILAERERLLAREPGDLEDPWLHELAMKYRVIDGPDHPLTPEALAELEKRVDIIPPSLALAQSVEESGWGTSRFAEQGNALFGMWSWGEDAIKPEQQRSGKGDYGIAAWDTPQDSVDGYMLNINRHFAYEDLRERRAELRAQGETLRGADLVETLTSYSERGQAYVDGLQGLMDYNRLHDADDAELVGRVIHLVPVGEGSGS
jgi:uncharacterized FlgJ-related protein